LERGDRIFRVTKELECQPSSFGCYRAASQVLLIGCDILLHQHNSEENVLAERKLLTQLEKKLPSHKDLNAVELAFFKTCEALDKKVRHCRLQ
jgi:hypothetical protein